MAVEDAHDRGHGGHEIVRGCERFENLGKLGSGTEAPADEDFKAAHVAAVGRLDRGTGAEVVNRREAAILLAARERDLEFPRQVLVHRVAEQEPRDGVGIRCRIEGLVRADAGTVTDGDVAHSVAAGLASRQPDFGQRSHQVRNVRQGHEVKLDVLPGGDVAGPPGRSLGHVGQAIELGSRQPTPRDLDADHLNFVLALAIDSVLKAKALEVIRVDAAGVKILDELIEGVDLAGRRP